METIKTDEIFFSKGEDKTRVFSLLRKPENASKKVPKRLFIGNERIIVYLKYENCKNFMFMDSF